jgi:hypothetical protein
MSRKQKKVPTFKLGFLASATLAAVVLLIFVGVAAERWNPVLSHDTKHFFYPTTADMDDGLGPMDFVQPFLTNISTYWPDSHDVKPVFVVALKVWHGLYHYLDPYLTYPNHHVFSRFLTFSIVLTLLSFVFWGYGMGVPALGLSAGLLSIMNDWALPTYYFNSYQAASTLLLVLAYANLHTLLCRPILAGVLMSMNVMVNQSATVFCVSLLAPFVVQRRPEWRKVLKFLVGAFGFWLSTEILVGIFRLVHGISYQWRTTLLLHYLDRNRTDQIQEVHKKFFAWIYLWNFSSILTVLFILGALLCIWRFYLRKSDAIERALLVTIAATTLLIEVRTGPKFSRTYALLLPFVYVFVLWECRNAWLMFKKVPPRVRFASCALVAVLYLGVKGRDFVRMAHAYLDVPTYLAQSEPHPLYFFGLDNYLLIFNQMLEEQSSRGRDRLTLVADICQIAENRATMILSPIYVSPFNRPNQGPFQIMPDESKYSGQCQNRTWVAERTKFFPFFSHHPFMVLEEPNNTTLMIGQNAYDWSAYDSGIGRVSLWEISFSP